MSELHDHWLEQRIFLYESRYESRLRLSDNLYTNSHKRNKTEFIPLDELPEYKKDRKRYLNLTSRHDRNNKRIHKGNRKLRKTSQNKVHTDPILSKEHRNILPRKKRVRFNI